MLSFRFQNTPEDSQRAKALRREATKPERLLWNALSSLKSETKIRFRRQHPVHPYIADFACVKARLIVELNGVSHDVRHEYDVKRTAYLESQGWDVIRFSNADIETNLEGVVLTILEAARKRLPAHP